MRHIVQANLIQPFHLKNATQTNHHALPLLRHQKPLTTLLNYLLSVPVRRAHVRKLYAG